MKNYLRVESLIPLALTLALLGSLKHLAYVFSSTDGDLLMGWIKAVAVDVGLFALAYLLRQRRDKRRPVKLIIAGLVLFTAVSVYGNLAYEFLLAGQLPKYLAVIKPVVLAGTLPILVLLLSEISAEGKAYDDRKQQREAKRRPIDRPTQGIDRPESDFEANRDDLNDQKRLAVDHRRSQLASLLADDPGLTNQQLAAELAVSVSTIKTDKARLASTNGKGGGDVTGVE